MKAIIHEIRKQPHHIREVFMWLCVVITFSSIGFFWFRSTSQQLVALLNPKAAAEEASARALAQADTQKTESPFKTVFKSWADLRANISDIINFKHSSVLITNAPQDTTPPQALPLSKRRQINNN